MSSEQQAQVNPDPGFCEVWGTVFITLMGGYLCIRFLGNLGIILVVSFAITMYFFYLDYEDKKGKSEAQAKANQDVLVKVTEDKQQ